MGFFIPVSSLKVFGHSIHSERRRIYLGKSIQALQNDTIIIMNIQFQGHPVNIAMAFIKKFDVCFYQFLIITKTFRGSQLLKYLIKIELIWLSVTKHKPKLLHGLTCHFMLDRLHWCAKQRNRTSVPWASCDIHISPFSKIYTKPLAMSYWYLCWIVWCINQVTLNAV